MLTDKAIRALKDPEKDRWHRDGKGLYLRHRTTGGKSWVLRRKKDRGGNITLGAFPDLGCAAARVKAAEFTGKRVTKVTLGELLEDWYTEVITEGYRRPHHVRGYIDRLDSSLKSTKLRDLERLEVRRVARRYAEDKGPVAARRLLSILKTALRFAVDAGYIDVSPIDRLNADLVAPAEATRERVLNDAEIRALWVAESQHTALLRFLLLTGQRIGETQLATWDDIAGERWSISAAHTKNGRAHWVALSSQARAILDSLSRERRLIFGSATTTGVQAWLRRWCEREGIEPAFRPHDLRRTCATRLNELGVLPHVVEKILNHTMQGVMAVYNRAEYEAERVEAMRKWADELARILG
ncbi:MAG TPA: tyrosine-type recombinase/integrase [Steroidobacteraceae bacterium]|nr:tyrosine-type recombinase/integrase [Steroidobacteraceae bacterium]